MKFDEAVELMINGKFLTNDRNHNFYYTIVTEKFYIKGSIDKEKLIFRGYYKHDNNYFHFSSIDLVEILANWEIYEPPKKKLTFWQSIKNWFGRILDKEKSE